MVIKRYFSEDIFNRIKGDFGFLIDRILQSGFEYDLQIRDNYFNLYYKGNSLGKISFSSKTGLYNVRIHHKFVDQKIKERFKPQEGTYLTFIIPKKQLHPLFSQSKLNIHVTEGKNSQFSRRSHIRTDDYDRQCGEKRLHYH